jgi:nitroreductase
MKDRNRSIREHTITNDFTGYELIASIRVYLSMKSMITRSRRMNMDACEAIRTRRSIGLHQKETPPREEIEQLIDSARWAPNHRMTEPWRFTVFTGNERETLGKAQAAALAVSGVEDENLLRKAAGKTMRAPVVIIVHALAGNDDIETLENRYATAAAVQNLLIEAHALGLGAIWRTGPTIYSDDVAKLVGAGENDAVVAAVYVGYPDAPEKKRSRRDVDEITSWRDGS